MDDEDRKMIKELYGLSDDEVFEAEKLYNKGSFSICKSAKIIRDRRKECLNNVA